MERGGSADEEDEQDRQDVQDRGRGIEALAGYVAEGKVVLWPSRPAKASTPGPTILNILNILFVSPPSARRHFPEAYARSRICIVWITRTGRSCFLTPEASCIMHAGQPVTR